MLKWEEEIAKQKSQDCTCEIALYIYGKLCLNIKKLIFSVHRRGYIVVHLAFVLGDLLYHSYSSSSSFLMPAKYSIIFYSILI